MQPRFNKLITLLLLLGIFAFLMEAEQRVVGFARANLSHLTSSISYLPPKEQPDSINPFANQSFLSFAPTLDSLKADNTKSN
ncbi:MAG: hypothetical protein AAGA66_06350 [Bacteroidota bacterium]